MEMSIMVATVAKWGNSLAVRIPQNLAQEVHLTEGSQKRKRYSLDELIKEITPENLHTEINSGIAVGNEVW
jgi:antitoxin MazE